MWVLIAVISLGQVMTIKIKESYDVVIVGAGPCGVTAANILGRAGISTLIIDKEADIVTIPRAVGICEEGSRIIDTLGILDDPELEFRQINKVLFCDKPEHAVFHADTYQPKSGHRILRTFHQPDLERSLRNALIPLNSVDLVTSTQLKSFNDKGQGVDLVLKKEDEPEEILLNCRYLLACDGASSDIRKQLNIGFSGATYPQDWMILDVENNPQSSSEVIFGINPERPSVTLPGPGNKRRWEFVVKKNDNPERLFETANLSKLLGGWGDVDEMKVSRKAIYTFHARTAEKYQQGNVFLLGDAAHITPPFAGQGMMAGLRDVYNLSWKLTCVLKGQLSDKILDSYQEERIPQSRQVIKFAQCMGSVILPQDERIARARNAFIMVLGLIGVHTKSKGMPVDKVPNHINGAYLKHVLVSKLLKTGIEFPQYWLEQEGKQALVDKYLGEHFYLLGWNQDPEDLLDAKTLARWQSMAGKKAIICDRYKKSINNGNDLLIDETKQYESLFKGGKRIILIRPDKMMVLNVTVKHFIKSLNLYMNEIGCEV
jgi:3-(3-hydroxy-phenyl)propionate hydroxylase